MAIGSNFNQPEQSNDLNEGGEDAGKKEAAAFLDAMKSSNSEDQAGIGNAAHYHEVVNKIGELNENEIEKFVFDYINNIQLEPDFKVMLEIELKNKLISEKFVTDKIRNDGQFRTKLLDKLAEDLIKEFKENKKINEPNFLNLKEINDCSAEILYLIKGNLELFDKTEVSADDEKFIKEKVIEKLNEIKISEIDKKNKIFIGKITREVIDIYDRHASEKLGEKLLAEKEEKIETSAKNIKPEAGEEKTEETEEKIPPENKVEAGGAEQEKSPEKMLDEKRTAYSEACKNFDKKKYKKFIVDNYLPVKKINIAFEEAKNLLLGEGDAEENRQNFIKKLRETGFTEEIAAQAYNAEAAKLEYNNEKQNYGKIFKAKKEEKIKAELEKKYGSSENWKDGEKEKKEFEELLQAELYKELIINEHDLLAKAQIEDLPPKEKDMIDGMIKGWMKLGTGKRLFYSTILMTGAVAGFGGFGASAAVGYAGYRFARGLAAVLAGKTAGKLFEKGFEKLTAKKFKEKQEVKEKKIKTELNLEDLKKAEKEYQDILKEKLGQEKKKIIGKAIASLAGGVGAALLAGHYERAHAGGEEIDAKHGKTLLSEEHDVDKTKTEVDGISQQEIPVKTDIHFVPKAMSIDEMKAMPGYKPTMEIPKEELTLKPRGEVLSEQKMSKAVSSAEAATIKPATPEAPAVKIEGKIDTLSEAVEKALNQEGVSDETKNNFINRWLGDKIEISADNRGELLNKAIRKLSIGNVDMDDNIENVKNLVYEGNKVQLKADGNFEVFNEGHGEARKVAESELRRNAEAKAETGISNEDLVKEADALAEKKEATEMEKLNRTYAPENLPVADAPAEIPAQKSGINFSELDHRETRKIITGQLHKEYNVFSGGYDQTSHLRPGEFMMLDDSSQMKIDYNLNEHFEKSDVSELQDKVKKIYKDLSPEEKQKSLEELIKNRYNEFFPEEENIKTATAEATVGTEATPVQSTKIIPEKSLGQLSAEASSIENAALSNRPEFFTGFNLGNIVENKPNLEKGIIEISYPDNNINKLIIDFDKKHFIIGDRKELREFSWKYKQGIDSMEKIKNYIHDELEKKLIE